MLFGESMFVWRACNEINLTEVHCFIGETHLKFLACTVVDCEVIVYTLYIICIMYICMEYLLIAFACHASACLTFVVFILCLLD